MIKLILNRLIDLFLIVENHIDVQDQVNQVEYLPLKQKSNIKKINFQCNVYFFF